MRARLACLVGAIAVVLAVVPIHFGGVVLADSPLCPSGTNWDNSSHTCK
jgi:hypothetical protein